MKTVNIYTDGACRGNPGIGGWGVLIEYADIKKNKLISVKNNIFFLTFFDLLQSNYLQDRLNKFEVRCHEV